MTATPISMRIDGREVVVAPGTTVAAALWNAGTWRFRTSIRGEPRGPVCGMGICFECRVTIDGVPHRRACLVPCAPGMVVETAGDPVLAPAAAPVAAEVGRGPAGTPAVAEVRRGQAGAATSRAPDPADASRATAGDDAFPASAVAAPGIVVDVAVVGAGPAGIAAASLAAEAGATVLLLDQAVAPGGQIWRRPAAGTDPDRRARRWLDRLAACGARRLGGATVLDVLPGAGRSLDDSSARDGGRELVDGSLGGDRLGRPAIPGTGPAAVPGSGAGTGAGPFPGLTLLVEHDGQALRVEARRLIIATGARERFVPFPGWTLPNVVGAGGAQALLKSGARLRGRRAVVAGSGPLLLPVAAALVRAGAALALVAEQAPAAGVARFAATLWRRPRLLSQAARLRSAFWRAPYRCGVWVTAAHGEGDGDGGAVRAATLTDGRRSWRVECDLLACAHGLTPNLELARRVGCELRGGRGNQLVVAVDERQQTSVPGVYCAGEPAGVGGLELALVTGQIAGLAAATAPGESAPGACGPGDLLQLARRRAAARRHLAALDRAFRPRSELRQLAMPETIVCRCEDVPLGRLDPGWGPRQAKLYTRAGMGPCQGRVCGPALALLLGWEELDTVRAPLEPAALSTLAELGAAAPTAALSTLAEPGAAAPTAAISIPSRHRGD
jgi:D-hydroxyproline dehydrogenase subunit alpha